MSRSLGGRATLALIAILAAGCQDYNFNPVGRCVIQPGSERVTLSSVSTADVLFVVDDSGSMGAEQKALGRNFSAFINSLDAANAARVANGLEPFDFHIAVTSTSVFWNYPISATCSSTCPDAQGQLVCCAGSSAVKQPKACTPGQTTCPGTTTCSNQCAQFKGEYRCCNADGSFAAAALTDLVPCSNAGAQCGTFERHYNFSPTNCNAGVAALGWPYPQGDFVSWTSGTAANPRVLHFDKQIYGQLSGGTWVPADPATATNRQGFTRQQLIDAFAVDRGSDVFEGNVITGTCGSGEEQGFSAARLAIEKAVAGQQRDTYAISGGKVQTWDATNRVASSTAEWLHDNAKLVIVFVGDEDDCSSPADPAGGIVMTSGDPGNDACTHDQDPTNTAPNGHKLYDVTTRFVDYFTGLGRPLGAAFIESAVQTSCLNDQCTPGICTQPGCTDTMCGGQAAANRFFAAAGELRGRGVDVVEGSICDPRFDVILQQIAEIVKPPSGLVLPTKPAESAITLLRIADASGKTRKVCGRPEPEGAATTLAGAQTALDGAGNRYDWWFTATRDPGPPVTLSQYVYINPQGRCIANPGETYSADYLGQLPAGGCGDDAGALSGDAMCAQKLGSSASSWTCYAGVDAGGACLAPAWNASTQTGSGTCVCGDRASVCH